MASDNDLTIHRLYQGESKLIRVSSKNVVPYDFQGWYKKPCLCYQNILITRYVGMVAIIHPQ